MTEPTEQPAAKTSTSPEVIKLLTAINRLTVKAVKSTRRESLIFIILNDTAQIVQYDRAVLWQLGEGKPKLLGVSGQTKINKWADIAKKWKIIIDNIKDRRKVQELHDENLLKGHETLEQIKDAQAGTTVLWLPLFSGGKFAGGLWLERWNGQPWRQQEIEVLAFLNDAYGAAWERFLPKAALWRIMNTRWLWYGALVLLALLMFIRVPLRVVAPCEIVPEDPVVVTAPLEGIVEEVIADPGQFVTEGQILFEYDKRVPLQELRVAEKQAEITRSELDRSTTLGLQDPRSRAEIAVLKLRLQKEEIRLALAQYRASQLTVTAPQEGYVVLDDPDQWRGKPVLVGERVLILSPPEKTKVRIWLPEDDNIEFDTEQPVKVFLNIAPESSYRANITYIANYSSLGEKQIPSFVAEAAWVNASPDVKTGLKGTAVLYGHNVSLFYFIMRKPWTSLRRWTGF